VSPRGGTALRGGEVPQLTIELSAEEVEVLHALAKRKRRSDAQQAAHTLVRALGALAEAKGRGRGAGSPLAPQEQVGAVEGHRDGAAGGVDQVVVGAAGEPE
jgi:hypothetical protein